MLDRCDPVTLGWDMHNGYQDFRKVGFLIHLCFNRKLITCPDRRVGYPLLLQVVSVVVWAFATKKPMLPEGKWVENPLRGWDLWSQSLQQAINCHSGS